MITCKEDLINTRIDATNKELLSLYVNAAEEYGFCLMGNRDKAEVFENFIQNKQTHCCTSSEGLFARCSWDLYVATFDNTVTPNNYKVLTLADFYLEELPKPTKTEYTPMNFKCASEAVKFIEDGGVFYYNAYGREGTFMCEVNSVQDAVLFWKEVYKKEEVVQEWFTEVVEYCETVSNCSVEVSPDSEKLGITGIFTKDQLVRFSELIIKNKDL